MRFGNIILVYFVIGAVLWGSGAIAWSETGVATQFIDNPDGDGGNPQVNEETAGQIDQTSGIVPEAAESAAGPVIMVWNLITGFIGFVFWPVTVLISVGAPNRVIVLLGGSLSVAFFVGVVRVLGNIS